MSTAGTWTDSPPVGLRSAPRRDWLRGALLSGAIVLALACVEALALGRLPLNLYDVSFTLDWGRELIHGHVPDVHVSGASTPHPLSIASGAFAALFGQGGLDVMRAVVFVAGGAVGVALLAMGRACHSIAIGVVAALALMLSEPFVVATLGQATASDLPSLAAVLGALALELSRPRCGVAPLVLLSIAGLWRPEVWLLSGVYWLYVAPGRDWRSRGRLALLAVSAPVIWAGTDLAITGNPLYSLTYTREATEAAKRPTGFTHAPAALWSTLESYFSTPVLVGAGLGVALDVWLRRLPRLLWVALALTVVSFAALGAANLPLDERYALPTTVLLAVYFGYFVMGWRAQPGGWLKRAWALVAVLVAVLALVLAPSNMRAIAHARTSLSAQAKVEGQLGSLLGPASLRGLIGSCGPIQASYRIVPILAYDLGQGPRAIATVNTGVPQGGTVVEPAPGLAAQQFETHPYPSSAFTRRGYEVIAANDSWTVYAHCS
jgi:hypothetical protein